MKILTGQKPFFLGAIFLFAFFSFLNFAKGDAVDDLQEKIRQKNEEIKQLEEAAKQHRDSIVSVQQVGKTLKGEISRIDKNITQIKRDISVTQKKIERTRFEIENLAIETRSKEIAIQKMRGGLSSLVQVASETDQESLLASIIKNDFLSNFFGQIDASSKIQDKILASLENLRKLKQELQVKKANAEGKETELEVFDDSLRDQKRAQDEVKKDRSDILKVTQNQEKRYQELLRETEKKQEAILREMEDLEKELRKRIDVDSLPTQRRGLLQWPTEGRMSQGYGETPFTKGAGRHFYSFHNGIDITSAVGTPIYAADDGKILATGNTDTYCPRGAYGRYIVIDHQNNLASMYAHLSSMKVSAGQEVKKGAIIGYMGSSGLSTGPHLHFTLYDARTVEIKLGKIGTCGVLPFGGSLNPLLYLN